jgi:Tol biopolymer transport system component
MHTSRSKDFYLPWALLLCTALTAGSALATFPGKNGRIVFTANTGGTFQVYTINPDGSNMVQLTNLPPTENSTLFPSYSPDGLRVAFSNNAPDMPGTSDLYVINADGTGLIRLTNDGLSSAPRWSPDGTRLVFAHGSVYGTNVITTMSSDGSGVMKSLTPDIYDAFGNVYMPDGRIVFSSQLGGLLTATWIMNADGTNKRRLTPAPLETGGPDTSPNGHNILVWSKDIFSVSVDQAGITPLTHPFPAQDISPCYSPDGTQIVFGSNRLSSDGSMDLFVMNADGSKMHRIATGLTVGGCPDDNCLTPTWGPMPMK